MGRIQCHIGDVAPTDHQKLLNPRKSSLPNPFIPSTRLKRARAWSAKARPQIKLCQGKAAAQPVSTLERTDAGKGKCDHLLLQSHSSLWMAWCQVCRSAVGPTAAPPYWWRAPGLLQDSVIIWHMPGRPLPLRPKSTGTYQHWWRIRNCQGSPFLA